MEAFFINALEPLGISSVVSGLLYLLVSREAYHRKEKRDGQINELQKASEEIKVEQKKHIEHHSDLEKGLIGEVKQIYERLNPAIDILNELKGYMRGKNDKGN